MKLNYIDLDTFKKGDVVCFKMENSQRYTVLDVMYEMIKVIDIDGTENIVPESTLIHAHNHHVLFEEQAKKVPLTNREINVMLAFIPPHMTELSNKLHYAEEELIEVEKEQKELRIKIIGK